MQDYWGLEDDSIINKPKRKSEGANNEDEQPISSGSNGNRLLIEKWNNNIKKNYLITKNKKDESGRSLTFVVKPS